MKALLNSGELSKQLRKISPVMGKNTVLPILTSVLLDFEKEKLTIQATDLETTIHTSMQSNSKQEFQVLVSYSDLSELCSKLPSQPIFIEKTDNAVVITADNSKFRFPKSEDVKTYPPLPKEDFLFDVEVDDSFFWALTCANHCKSTDSLMVKMNGVCVDSKKDFINIVGTNALVAYKTTLPIKTKKSKSVMVCEKFIQLVKSFTDAKISVGDKFLQVDTPEVTIVTRLLDAPFVEYDFVYPRDTPEFNFKSNRKDFLSAIGLASIGSSAETRECVLKFAGDKVVLTAQDVDFGKEGEVELRAISSVEIEKIGLNATQIALLLNNFTSEDVELSITAPNKAVFVKPVDDSDTLCLIMPLYLTPKN